jgi:hypothetical protein
MVARILVDAPTIKPDHSAGIGQLSDCNMGFLPASALKNVNGA